MYKSPSAIAEGVLRQIEAHAKQSGLVVTPRARRLIREATTKEIEKHEHGDQDGFVDPDRAARGFMEHAMRVIKSGDKTRVGYKVVMEVLRMLKNGVRIWPFT